MKRSGPSEQTLVRPKEPQALFPRNNQKEYGIEVVKSHGCSVGMKPGDKLVFKSLGVLDLENSSPWCAQAMRAIPGAANLIQDRFVSGLDPNGGIYKNFSCEDVGLECGYWGQVLMKVYVEDV